MMNGDHAMKLRVAICSIGLCLLLVPVPALAQAKQKPATASQQVHVDQLPPAVTAAIQKAYPTGSIVTVYKTTRGTEERYQLWVKETASSPAVVVTATPDGQIQTGKAAAAKPARKTPPATAQAKRAAAAPVSTDGETVAIDQLPKPVTKAIKDAYPKDTIVKAFKVAAGGDVVYQIVLDDVGSLQPMRVFVRADGTFQKR